MEFVGGHVQTLRWRSCEEGAGKLERRSMFECLSSLIVHLEESGLVLDGCDDVGDLPLQLHNTEAPVCPPRVLDGGRPSLFSSCRQRRRFLAFPR